MLTRTASLDSRTEEFCSRIRKGVRPLVMSIQPSPGWAELNECFRCVREKVRRDGGRIQLGWAIWEWPGVYLETERHAVYAPSDDGPWLDISPSVVPEITQRLFLPDVQEAEYDFSNEGTRTENIREALTDDERIHQLFHVTEQKNKLLNSIPGFGEVTLRGDAATLFQRLKREQAVLTLMLAMEYTPPDAHCFCGSGLNFKKCHAQMRAG